jgi:dihydropteroate synthase
VEHLREILPDLGARTLVMGVLNATPDSFSDGGRFLAPERALDGALAMMDAGADLIDVGGESTRPGAPPVDEATELARVVPIVELLARRGIGPLSVDTTKAEVARHAIAAGAAIVNDISAMSFDPDMAAVVAGARAGAILMHTRGRPSLMQAGEIVYEGGVVAAVQESLSASIQLAVERGVSPGAIAIDPGVGFGKTVDQNLELLRNLRALAALGRPIVVGTSRKSFIGKITGKDVAHRELGTAATVALSIAAGADIVRVHDVALMVDVVAVADAWVRVARPGHPA